MWINDYPVTLDKLPVFVKAGAIIPMYPEMLYDAEKIKDPITWDVYPFGNSTYTLYEDDGVTREHREGAFATTAVNCQGNENGFPGPVTINVGASVGEFEGKLDFRSNHFEIHFPQNPDGVRLDGELLPVYYTFEDYDTAQEGYYFDPADRGGIIHAKTLPLPTDSAFELTVDYLISNEDITTKNEISVFPNPTTGKFVIGLQAKENPEITLYNTEGKLLFTINPGNTETIELDLTGEPDGIYHVYIRAGHEVISRKITKSK
jgi:hypothetical protein